MLRPLLAVSAALASVLVLAPAATSAQLTLEDPAGDASYAGGLDLIDATLLNRRRVIEVIVDVARLQVGDIVVSLDARHGTGVRLITDRDARGRIRTYRQPGAFTDRTPGRPVEPCRGYGARWRPGPSTITFRLPSRCFRDGQFGDLRFTVLAEGPQGDTDITPDTSAGVSAYVERG